MWKHKTLIAPLCLVLLCSIGEAQRKTWGLYYEEELMELHVPSGPTNQSTLDCNISSPEPLIIQNWAWLHPNGTELCKVSDSQPVSGPCKYVPQKQLILNLEPGEMNVTGNYTCIISSNRGIKGPQVEVKINPSPRNKWLPRGTSSSTSSSSPGLAWVGLLLALLMM